MGSIKMTPADYKAVPQINDTCTGCAFKWIRESQCVGPCPDWARPKCTEDKIRWVDVRK